MLLPSNDELCGALTIAEGSEEVVAVVSIVGGHAICKVHSNDTWQGISQPPHPVTRPLGRNYFSCGLG